MINKNISEKEGQNIKMRLLTAAIGIPLLVLLLFYSYTIAWDFAITLLSLIGTYEILSCVGMKNHIGLSVPSLIYSVVLPLFTQNSYKFLYNCTIIYVLVILFAGVISKKQYPTRDISLAIAMTIYVVNAFTALIMIRSLDKIGLYVCILVFVGAWMTDTFAYFCGRLFGKHKLIPEISPKKTFEGALGGIIFCVLAFWAYGAILTNLRGDIEFNLFGMLFTGLITSVVAQFGDLLASAIKRNFGSKDYGMIFPGHGGVLDRFDSILTVAPFLLAITSRSDLFYLFK
ncbi:Phosphatidate cytidylyltransferase [bioreactor metagenome]|uniref:Phosphatidate cytidylyltransferase n=1 Tax=bioreactor metagenome TaxID=1076179 RepID=A0A645EFQ1_9ZZZZ|nr:phosphatidate cytidylyltransferase [Oscillospiraceae bacterium]